MELNRSQKKYLKKNLRNFPLSQISKEINVPEKEILNFLKTHWRREKYQKFLTKLKQVKNPLFKFSLQPSFSPKTIFKENWKAFAFLAFLVFVVYFNSLNNDFVSDDISGIVENKNLGNFSYLFTKPLSFLRDLFYFIVYKIWGVEPLFFRLINIFFHLGSVWLIYLSLFILTNPALALFTASLFAVHPILTEAVSWISGGPYSQYSFFLLLSFLLYAIAKIKNSRKIYFVSLFAFFLSLLSTEKGFIFPLILLVFEFSFDKISKNWQKIVPFFVLSTIWIFLFFTKGTLVGRVATLQTQYYQEPGLENPLLQIPIAISSYLQLILWPNKLTLYHSEMIFTQTEYFLRVGILLLFLAMIIFFFKKKRQVFFWFSFFIISLLPTLTPLKISWIVAERYVYLGAIGIIFLFALVLQKIGQITKNQKIAYGLLGIVLVALATKTILRNNDWKNQDTLWLATAKVSPSSPQNHNNLGDYYSRQGNLEKAAEEFKKAIELKPNYGDAHHNLANTYQQMGKTELAIENYQKALSFNPNLWQSYQNLAVIYFQQEKFDSAGKMLEKAVIINPQNPSLHFNLGLSYLNLKKNKEAKEEFKKVLQLDPQNQTAKQQLELIK